MNPSSSQPGRRSSLLRAGVAAALVWSVQSGPANAAPPSGPDPQSALVPPAVVTKTAPRYPAGATGSATVIVEIVVGVDGSVEEARVVEGGEPFAGAALDAARTYRFEPARRGDRPVRARVRVAVAFTETKGTEAEAEPLPDAPPIVEASAPKPPAAEKIEEVQILGRRDVRSPTEHRMKRAEMRVLPGAFGDPFRAIDMLPGVVPIISGLPYFYIRGAPPSAVGYYVDEVRVPYLFHFALGPGVIQPSLIEEVAMHPAAFPGRYGRYAGGIVAGTTRDPSSRLRGEAQIRIFDAGAYVEAPFAGGRGTAGVGGRYSYTAGVISLFAPDATIDYRDYNARVSWQLDDRWRVSAFTFGSYDYASQIESRTRIEEVLFASEFHRLDLRLDRRGADGSRSRVATTFGLDRTRLEGSRFAQSWVTGLRGWHRWSARSDVDLEIGADVLADHYTGDLPSPYAVQPSQYEEARLLFSPRTDTASGAWASATHRPRPGWDLTAILRGDVFTSAGVVAFGPSPRLSARVPIVPKLAFLAALGIAPQPPAFAIPVPAVGYSGLPGGLAFAYQKSAGVELALPLRFSLKTVGYHHSYFAMRDFRRERGALDIGLDEQSRVGATQAFGLELSLSRKLSERFGAFVSATLSRSQLGSSRTTPVLASPFDRTYVFQVGGVVDLGRGWRTSSRFLTYGGWPLEPDPITGRDTGRLPGFARLDARIEKRWTLPNDRWISLVLEGLNVTGSMDVIGRRCDRPDGCRNQEIGPIIIPSIGVEAGL